MRFALRALPLALWALTHQRIAVTRAERPHRTTRRGLEREGSPLADREIRILDLRRPAGTEEQAPAAAHYSWTHRWIVSGHWRRQWLPSEKKHRLTWIAPFIKGPDDKPLIVKPTVHRIVR